MSELRRSAPVDRAARRLVAPLAKFYLASGLGFGNFLDAAKRAFVAAAIEQARDDGEEPTQSRIATVTGFSLPEVRRLLKGPEDASLPMHDRRARASRVLDGWWADPEFHELGQPRALSVRGPVPSVVTLVKRYAGGERAAPILRELMNAKAVRRLDDGRYKVVRRTCTNVPGDKESIALMSEEVADHLSASLYNLQNPEEERHFLRAVRVDDLDPDSTRSLFARLQDSAHILIQGAADDLRRRRYKAKADDPAKKPVRICVQVQVLKEPVGTAASGPRHGRGTRLKRRRKDSVMRNTKSRGVGED